VTVTLVDGVVLARAAVHHSVNYRSVVLQGLAEPVADEKEKRTALAAVVEAVVAGRTGGTREPSAKDQAATAVLAVRLKEVSLKVRSGPPADDPDDLLLNYWAGVIPLRVVAGDPVPEAGVVRPYPADLRVRV